MRLALSLLHRPRADLLVIFCKERENQTRFFFGWAKTGVLRLVFFVSQRLAQRLPYARGLSCTADAGVAQLTALRGGLWRRLPISKPRALWGSSCAAGRSVAAVVALRGGLWRRGRSVAKRSSCAAGRSVAAAFLPISKPRALWGSSCAAGRSVAAGAVCGKKK